MKTLIYKVNGSIADPSAMEFGLGMIEVRRGRTTDQAVAIVFETFYENEVVVEYDRGVYVEASPSDNTYNSNTQPNVPDGIVTVPKSSSINYTSHTQGSGVKIWFPYDGRSSIQIKVHKAYHLGGLTHENWVYPSPGYGRCILRPNILDMMEIKKIFIVLNGELLMEDKSFDTRNFIYFNTLRVLSGGYNFHGSLLRFPKYEEAAYDMDWVSLTNYPLTVDDESFNRRFTFLNLSSSTTLNGNVTTLSGFKVRTLYVDNSGTADTFAALLASATDPFYDGCNVRLLVSDATGSSTKSAVEAKVSAAGGEIFWG